MSTGHSKRRIYLATGMLTGAILLWIAAQLIPKEQPPLAFGVLCYTNEPSGTCALFTVTNAGSRSYRPNQPPSRDFQIHTH